MDTVFTGTVIEGDKLGRTMGFPTANIAIADNDPVADGVYAAEVEITGKKFGAMVSVGRKPTFGPGRGRLLEAHLLGFEDDLYGKEITVRLVKFIRPERKFASVDELKAQIIKDKQEILKHISL